MKLSGLSRKALLAAAFCISVSSCIYVNDEVGQGFIPVDERYDVYIDTLMLEDIQLRQADKMSGYSSSRVTVGAIRDDDFGTTYRSSAFTLVPVTRDLDFGENPRFKRFHVSIAKEDLSCPDESQKHIIQNFKVHRLLKALDENVLYSSSLENGNSEYIGESITVGTPIYTGGDSLTFDLTEDFAKAYMEVTEDDLDSLSHYTKKCPGIYISVDEPISNGGRINLFKLTMDISDYYITGNYALLSFTSDYGDRKDVDTSFIYYFGPQDIAVYNETESKYETATRVSQYAFNVSWHESKDRIAENATDRLYVEGGGGIKPVISGKEIRDKALEAFAKKGLNPDNVVLNKASLILPFEFPANYEDLKTYPTILSPTCRIKSTVEADEEGDEDKVYYTFAGLTDYSISTENQGNINRSLSRYEPDITHHVQEIIKKGEDDDDYENYDIWMLIMAEETTESSDSGSDLSDYYQNLAMYNYYNSLYGYGYGGYGYGYGYDSYGYSDYYGYSNYINYMMMLSSASSSSTTTSTEMDKDRYYKAIMTGPESATATDENKPMLTLVYSVRKGL